MKFIIKHDVPGRIRVHMDASGMTFTQADTLQYYLKNLQGVTNAKVYERTADAVVEYRCSRKAMIEAIAKFRYSNVEVPEDVLATSGRAINSHYTEKLADQVLWRMTKKLFIPAPVCAVLTTVSSMKYIYKGIRTLLDRKLEVPVLDATAIGVSILRRDFNTASSVMFLLGIGEIIEDWTHKKSVDDLARTMSLNVNKVWLKTDDAEVQVSVKDVKDGDNVIIRMGNVIPFDGTVISGEAMVNQASLTGESEPVRRGEGTSVFAGTVVEEGEIVFRVKRAGGSSKYDKIVRMIEESEKLKSGTSRTTSVTTSSTWPSAWMISMPHTQSTRKWTASALKIRQWASILSPTRTATGWRSFPQSKQKTLGAAALSVFFILLTGLFCSFFDSGCILLKLSPDERTVSFESLP